MAPITSWRERMRGRNAAPAVDHSGLTWWREARFGMFIHWGLYALPAGVWDGKNVPGIGEWIMFRRKIPRNQYAALANRFNPVRFDAQAWVDLAVQAGMRYLVITSKHHDGFAIFRSQSCPYNIIDATPFGRDPIAELSSACTEAGIKLGFYYSQDQDWHDPDGSCNDWDFDEQNKNFGAYLERKVKPQIRELLTQYGPIGLIWFDTPYTISREHSIELRDLVHSLQPDCLVSGRIGNDVGDYGSLGDNQIPAGRVLADYETPATLNDTWGYKVTDHNWKLSSTLILLLIDLASKGVNYLLNVGPTAEGVIPEPSADRLREIGAWMEINGESIYGSQGSPFPYEHDGVRMTSKRGQLFIHLLDHEKSSIVIHGLRNQVTAAEVLGLSDPVNFLQDRIETADIDRLELTLPNISNIKHVPVIALNIAGDAEVDELTVQQPDGTICLHAHQANIRPGIDSTLEILSNGLTAGWTDSKSMLSWQARVYRPGTFTVVITAAPIHDTEIVTPHGMAVTVENVDNNKRSVEGTLSNTERSSLPRAQYFPEFSTPIGDLIVDTVGTHTFTLEAIRIITNTPDGVTVFGATLVMM